MSVPDFMPVLSAGPHANPSEGACVMEMVSYLAGEEWTDSPACTHPALSGAAQAVNDSLSDSRRHELIPLIGRLIGTAPTGTHAERKALCVALMNWALILPESPGSLGRRIVLIEVTEARSATEVLEFVNRATHYIAWQAADKVAFLTGLLDEYDRLTRRTEHHNVTTEDRARLAELTR